MKPSVAEHIANIVPYPPGKPIEELEREYGISGSIKLASNENPLGPSPKAVEAIVAATSKLNRYPDGSGFYLRKRLAEKHRLPFDSILLGNGSNEIIELVIRAFMSPGDEVMMPEPSFLLYKLVVQWMGGRAAPIPLKEDWGIDLDKMAEAVTAKTKVIFLTNPNNPTGKVISKTDFEAFLSRVPQSAAVVLDEAYIEFNTNPDTPLGFDYINGQSPAVIVLRTFSKAYGLAGLRIGLLAGHLDAMRFVRKVSSPYNVNSVALECLPVALEDESYITWYAEQVRLSRERIVAALNALCVPQWPSHANFVLMKIGSQHAAVVEGMRRRGILIRDRSRDPGCDGCVRITAGTLEQTERGLAALAETLKELQWQPQK